MYALVLCLLMLIIMYYFYAKWINLTQQVINYDKIDHKQYLKELLLARTFCHQKIDDFILKSVEHGYPEINYLELYCKHGLIDYCRKTLTNYPHFPIIFDHEGILLYYLTNTNSHPITITKFVRWYLQNNNNVLVHHDNDVIFRIICSKQLSDLAVWFLATYPDIDFTVFNYQILKYPVIYLDPDAEYPINGSLFNVVKHLLPKNTVLYRDVYNYGFAVPISVTGPASDTTNKLYTKFMYQSRYRNHYIYTKTKNNQDIVKKIATLY
jgi:hypothetical protein